MKRTAKKIAAESQDMWCDYYRDGDYTSEFIISEIENEIKDLLIQDTVKAVINKKHELINKAKIITDKVEFRPTGLTLGEKIRFDKLDNQIKILQELQNELCSK